MQVVFDTMMNTHVIPFFKANGFETKDINSETNKTLGIQSHYFHKIDGDLSRNFYFESNSENSAEKYEFKLDFGIYAYSFYQAIGLPQNDAPSGLGNLYYIIVGRITTQNDAFFNWLCDNDDGWRQWRG